MTSPTRKFAIGVDYGTSSVRALVVDIADGSEVATAVWDYRRGEAGVLLDPRDPHLARQDPADYLEGFTGSVGEAVAAAREVDGFDPAGVVGIGVDTTGSTPIPVDHEGTPLAFQPEFADDLAAHAWLWKDHTAAAEAAEITEAARDHEDGYLARCGGVYSSEWYWSKILHCKRTARRVFDAAWTWVELADFVPAWATGNTHPDDLVRGICAAGHKAMYAEAWGGLPSEEFLESLDPALVELRRRYGGKPLTADHKAGVLAPDVAERVGLSAGIPVAVGAFDAHMGAVGAGISPGTLVKIIGTSTCDIMVAPLEQELADVPGLCGIVPGSVMPGMYGLEAGQSAVGDIFNWFASRLGPGAGGDGSSGGDRSGNGSGSGDDTGNGNAGGTGVGDRNGNGDAHAALTREAEKLRAGESGLLALDWNNGNRTILVDHRLTGLLVGQTLHTTAAEMYRALVEATAFGALTIIRRLEEYGVGVDEVVNCGGIAEKNPFVMQVYADVCDRPMKVSRSAQTCALGAAIFGAVAGGAFEGVAEAQAAMTGVKDGVYRPRPEEAAVYSELYPLYRRLHDAFGLPEHEDELGDVMKRLIDIRDRVRRGPGVEG